MTEIKKKKIAVSKGDFEGAQDAETCLVWAKEFLEKDVTLEEEIAEIEGSVKNEKVWRAGAENNMERDMHNDNLTNLNSYLGWLNLIKDGQERLENEAATEGLVCDSSPLFALCRDYSKRVEGIPDGKNLARNSGDFGA